MKPPFSHVLLSLLLVFPFPILSTAQSSGVEKMIRELNLFPELDVNIVRDEPAVMEPKLVEKRIRLPILNDTGATVGNLGQHAGFFKLPHSRNARYIKGKNFYSPTSCTGATVGNLGQHAGFFKLPHSRNARMFYFFFESRSNKSSDPVVVWLSGGPGCSGSLALFYENGPFHLANSSSLIWNDFGWDKVSNLIYVDQPIGTGFSSTSTKSDIRSSNKAASMDFYDFLQAFFQRHSKYAKNEFYITGESYAGHYIPAYAEQIHQANRNRKKTSIYINIKGLAIGNGLTHPSIQYKAYPDYALNMNLINQSYYNHLVKSLPLCLKQIQICDNSLSKDTTGFSCLLASNLCSRIFHGILSKTGDINYYDIRKRCIGPLCYDFSNVEIFLNRQNVKTALGAGNTKFVSCSSVVHKAIAREFMKNFAVGLPELLEDGVKLLIYAGEYDLICNWLGNLIWVTAMEWSGQKKFQSANSTPFKVDGVKAGLKKRYGPLTFLKVHDAGHMVPMDQPKASLEMLSRWMQGQL